MRKFSSLVFLTVFAVLLSAFIVFAGPVINLNLLTPTVVCSSGNDTARYTVSASGIPANTNIVIYQSTDSTFNPYNSQGDSIGFIPGNAIPRDTVNFGTCVKTLGIFIDACGLNGTEPQNEYIIVTSGNGIKVSNLAINFDPANSNSGNNNDNDINTGTNPCGFKIPDATLINNLRVGSCNASNIIPALPTDSIPPNAIILCFTSDSVNTIYNVNGLCNLGYPIYVVQSACVRTIGAFTNAPSCSSTATTRYRKTIVVDKRQNCQDNFVYDRCGLFNLNGTYAIRQQGTDTARVSNNGIRRNVVDSCGGIDYAQLNFTADTTLKFRISTNFCNTGYHYIKAITHPNGSQPVSNMIKYKLVCNDITATSSTTNVCSGDSVKINLSSTDPNATFSWTVSGGANITGAVAGIGNSIKQVLSYSGNTKDSVTYTAISNDAGCIKTQTVKVVVNKCLICTPDFTAPDTVCVNTNVTLTNLTGNCVANNYWNFCSGNLNNTPTGTNLGNPNNQLNSPVYVELVSDGAVKYAFVVNHVTNGGAGNGQIVRLKYGSSYLNTPTVTNLGDLGITNNIKIEGIQIKKDASGNWFGFICSGGEFFSKIVRMNFGNSLDNTPTGTDLGAIGNLNFPGGLYLYQESNNWYGFITNALNSTLVRLSFGTSLSNTPTATNNTIPGVSNLGEFTFIEDAGVKYMFLNSTAAHIVNRLNFGNSYLNTPTVQSYNIPVNSDNYGIKLLKDCDRNFGFITHINNTITKMEFPTGLSGAPVFTNLGNIGTLNFPHSISNIFRVADSVYMFIPNVNSNSLSRLVFGNCTNSSIPSSTQVNPPVYTYNQTGTYNVSLTVDEGLPTQNTVCKSIVVVNPINKPDARINQISCSTDSIRLSVANIDATAAYAWSGPNNFSSTQPNVSIKFNGTNSQNGQYILTSTGKCGSKKDTVSINISCSTCTPNFTAPDTVCVGQNITITNLTSCQTTNKWDFCKQAVIQGVTGTNIGSPTNMPSRPLGLQIFKEGNNWIGFLGNDAVLPGAALRRLDFGTSLNNVPTITVLPTISRLAIPRYIRFIKEGVDWYAVVISGYNGTNYQEVAVLKFGNSLTNNPTMFNDLGNLGGLIASNESMSGVSLEKSGNNVIAMVSTFEGVAVKGKLYRVNFGSTITNLTPTYTDLGDFGVFTRLNQIKFIENNGNWYGFAANDGYPTNPANDRLYRLSFGNSLLNTPTVNDLGNPSSKMNRTYDLLLYNDCESLKLLGINLVTNELISFLLPDGITSNNLSAVSFGNIGNLNLPDAFSQVLIQNSQKYVFITNSGSQSLTRINLAPECISVGIPSSTQINPPVFHIDSIGTINVSLVIDENLPTEARTCQEIVVIDTIKKPDARINQITCSTDSIRLTVANINNTASYSWTGPNGFNSTKPNVSIKFNSPLQEGNYIVTTTGRCGTKKDTVSFVNPNLQVQVSGNSQICNGNNAVLSVTGTFDSVRWSNGTLGNQATFTTAGDYTVFVYLNGCSSATTFRVTNCQSQICNPVISGNKAFCQGDSITLNAGGGFTSYLWSTGAITQTIKVKTPGKYVVTVTGQNCTGKDSVTVIVKPIPQVSISGTSTFCVESQTRLTANADADSLRWNTNETSATISVSQAQNYVVTVYKNGCSNTSTVQVSLLDPPSPFSLGNDTTFCGDFTKILSTGIQSTEWSTVVTAAQITVTSAGTYIATISNDCGSVSDTIVISKNDLPIVNLGNDTAFCDGELVLNAPSEMQTYIWSTGAQSSSIAVTVAGTYSVKITDDNGCSATDFIDIASNCANDLWIPNAFTPNGDGVNDVFLVRGNPRNTTIEKFVIYNRWGNKVFEANNILPDDVNFGWDGKFKGEPAQFEVYGYEVIAKFSNGEKKILKGNVTLLK